MAAQLGDLGFAEAAPPDNDPLYPDGDMECVGQLRFGPAGQGAASTLALVMPCAELVRDDRPDDTVDVAVGTGFSDVNPPRAVRDALDQLAASGGGHRRLRQRRPGRPGRARRPPTPAVDRVHARATAREATCR